jgi:hypothetical protein
MYTVSGRADAGARHNRVGRSYPMEEVSATRWA